MLTKQDTAFGFALLSAVMIVVLLYILPIRTYKDLDGETMDIPMAVGYMEMARSQGLAAKEYFDKSPVFEDVKREDKHQSYNYPRHRFRFEYDAMHAPVLSFLYLPFIRAMGVSSDTIAFYSTFYFILMLIMLGGMAWKFYGRWPAVLSVILLSSNLIWLIHVKVAGMQWMPSVLMICCMAFAALEFMRTDKYRWLVSSAICLGLLSMTGSIYPFWGGLICFFAICMNWPRRRFRILLDMVVAGIAVAATVFIVVVLYALYYQASCWDILLAIIDSYTSRYSMGAIPGFAPTMTGRFLYCLKCMFIDSRQVDHPDKCLEGVPAISWIFALCFAAGFYILIRRRNKYDVFMVGWFALVLLVMNMVFLYSHRYALAIFPVMALIAGNGIKETLVWVSGFRSRSVFWMLCALMAGLLGYDASKSYHNYYTEYMHHKLPGFEMDRPRGHGSFATWLKQNYAADETLVVLGDPVMFPHVNFLFYTFESPYSFMYWSNYFSADRDPARVLAWEDAQMKKYKNIVFLFSTLSLGRSAEGSSFNDWSAFRAAHPNDRPVFQYAYEQRPPSMYAFVYSRE